MNGNSILLDTNTVLYLLGGDQTLASFLQHKQLYLSVISEIELLLFKKLTKKEVLVINSFIDELTVIDLTQEIKHLTIQIRKSSKLKIPDCIIAATSIFLKIPLISADKQLKAISNLDLVVYEK